jgi:hypothetical protein
VRGGRESAARKGSGKVLHLPPAFVAEGEKEAGDSETANPNRKDRPVRIKTNVKAGGWFMNRCDSPQANTGV